MNRSIVLAGLAASLLGSGVLGPGSALADQAACARLQGAVVEPASIRLPSGPARVESATWTPSVAAPDSAHPAQALPAHCRVLGAIAPLDPKAWPIRFQLNLPDQWNGKGLQYGGGGFNGVLITGLAPLRDAPPDRPPPLAQGYATWGTDSGHQNETLPEIQAFALNDEALANFAHAAYPKVRDVAVALLRARYGNPPGRIYFFGGSEGGREGLTMAQRYPDAFDGIVSVVPVIHWTALQVAGNALGQIQRDGGWIPPGKVGLLHRATLAACDGLDGLADGVVSRYEACIDSFEPASLRCPDGTDAGEHCLSEAQLGFVRALRRPTEVGVPLANGMGAYPGYPFGGEDQRDGLLVWQTGPKQPAFPLPSPAEQSRAWYYGNGAVRYFLARDKEFDTKAFRPQDFAARILAVSTLMDSTNPDLGSFAKRGGKLIVKENMSDYAQSPYAGIDYVGRVRARMGDAAAERFLRLYVTPGANHSGSVQGADGAPVPDRVDLLAALEAWVERGQAPGLLVQAAHGPGPAAPVTATRPMCRYPEWPRFRGTGDGREASGFECVGR